MKNIIIENDKQHKHIQNYRNRLRKKARRYIKSNCEKEGCNETQNLTIEHVIPLAKGGNNNKENLQTLYLKHHKEKDRLPKKNKITEKMLQITQYKNKWRIAIINERWEFDDMQQAQQILLQLLSLKNQYGEISDF